MLLTCFFVILDGIIFHSTRSLYFCSKIVICHLFLDAIGPHEAFLAFCFQMGTFQKNQKKKVCRQLDAQPSAGVKVFLNITRDTDLFFRLGIFGFYLKKK